MHTGAKSIDRFINRVILVRSTFVVRVEGEREREREYSDPESAPGDLAANSSWWTCLERGRLRVSLRPRNQRVHRRVFNARTHYVMHICKSSFEPTHDPYTWCGEEGWWERTRWKSHGNTAVSYGGSRGRRRDAGIRAGDKERNRVLLVHGGGQNIDLWGGLRGWCPRALHPRPPTLLILLLCLTRAPGW